MLEAGEGVDMAEVRRPRRLCDGRSAPMRRSAITDTTRLVKVPDGISDEKAAAMMLKGITAQYLLRQTFQVKPGMTDPLPCGGRRRRPDRRPVGARHWAPPSIGTAGSTEKIELALAHGYDHVINYRNEDFVARVLELTGGKNVRRRLRFRRQGHVPELAGLPEAAAACSSASAKSSGPGPALQPGAPGAEGLALCDAPDAVPAYVAKRDELDACAKALFDVVRSRQSA